MEEYQQLAIKNNLYALIENTNCDDDLLEKFEPSLIFTLGDIRAIRANGSDILPIDQSYQFYRRLLTSTSTAPVFELLLTALQETGQSISLQILQQTKPLLNGITPSSPQAPNNDTIPGNSYTDLVKPGRLYKSPSKAVLEFLKTPVLNILILECLDIQITLTRLVNTISNLVICGVTDEIQIGDLNILQVVIYQDQGDRLQEIQDNLQHLAEIPSKLLRLHSPQEPSSNLINHPNISRGKDLLEWGELTESFKLTLNNVFEECCPFGTPFPIDLCPNKSLIRLINADVNDDSFVGHIMQDYVEGIFRENKMDEEAAVEDLGKLAVRILFAKLRLFGNSEDDAVLWKYVEIQLLHRDVTKKPIEYKFTDKLFSHFFLGKYVATRAITSARLREAVFKRSKIKIPLFTGISDFEYDAYEFSNKTSMYFVNFHWESYDPQLDEISEREKLLTASLIGGYQNLSQILLSKLKISARMLRTTVIFGKLDSIYLALAKYPANDKDIRTIHLNDLTLLHVAVIWGKLELVEKFLHDFKFREMLNKENMRNVLHLAVKSTLSLEEAEFEERKSIVVLLTSMNKTLLYEKDEASNTPLLSSLVHLDLLKLLIELGADVSSKNRAGQTLAHVAAKGRTWQEYRDVLEYISRLKCGGLLLSKDDRGCTPLRYSVGHTGLAKAILEVYEAAEGVEETKLRKTGGTVWYSDQF